MEPVRRRALLPLLALSFLSGVCSILISAHSQAVETPISVVAAPSEGFAPAAGWVDDLEQRLKTYLAKKYPAYDFTPYARELDRVRGAVSRGDRWGAKREMGMFLQMLITHAYGLGDDAADELGMISNRIMPEEEFGIIYPGAQAGP